MNSCRWAARSLAVWIVGLGLSAIPTLAFDPAPGDTPILSDRWVIDGQYSFTAFKTSFQVGKGRIVGAWVRLEDDIGVDDSKDIWQLSGLWRWGSRSSLAFNYAQFSRTGAGTLEEDITIEDVTYDVGAKLEATIDWQQLNLAYRWSAVNTGTTEAGFSAGLSTIWVDGTFVGEGSITEPEALKASEVRRYKTGAEVLAPVPVLGGFIAHAFTSRLIFSTSADLFYLGVGDYSGSVVDVNATLRYFVTRNFGLGLNIFGSTVKVERSGDDPLTAELAQTGAGLVLTGAF